MAGNKHWTSQELDILGAEYTASTIEEMTALLPGRSKEAIQWKASQLGLLIRNGKQMAACKKVMANVTDEQFEFLKGRRNQSRVIREALELYRETLKKTGK